MPRYVAPEQESILIVAGQTGRDVHWEEEAPVVTVAPSRPWRKPVAVACAIAFCVPLLYAGYRLLARRSVEATQPVAAAQSLDLEQDIRRGAEWRDAATAAARLAMKAKSPAELWPLLVRDSITEASIAQYYATGESLPLGDDLNENYVLIDEGKNLPIAFFEFRDVHGRHRLLPIVDVHGEKKVDWGVLVGHSQLSLKDYLASPPATAFAVRARAEIVDYYNEPFADETRWLCVRLGDVFDENAVFGYIERRSPTAVNLVAECPDSRSPIAQRQHPITVILKKPADQRFPNQALIREVHSWSWYLPRGLPAAVARARALSTPPSTP